MGRGRRMGHAERKRRRAGFVGGAARALALGVAVGSVSNNAVTATRTLPAIGAAVRDAGGCRLRVTIWGEGAACGPVDTEEECDKYNPDLVQAFIGDERREAVIVSTTGTSGWREELGFDCAHGRDKLVVTLRDKLLRALATCEVGEASPIGSGRAMVCEGAHGTNFNYAVEYANLAPPLLMEPMRRLQTNTSDTPAPVAPIAEETFSPVTQSTDPPDEPMESPTPEPELSTGPPVDSPTPTPVEPATEEPTAEPVAAATDPPVDPPTSTPITPLTPAPMAPATEEPTPATEEPTPATEQPTLATEEPTPATEEPTPATEEPTPATEEPTPTPVTPATEEPTPTPVTPATDAPVAPVAAPTGETVAPMTSPTPQPVAAATDAPVTPLTAAPTAGAPPVVPTPNPTTEPTPVPASSTTTPEMTLAPEMIGTEEPTQSPVVTDAPVLSPVGGISTPGPVVTPSPFAQTSPPPTSSPSAPASAVLPPTSETPTSSTGTSNPDNDDGGGGSGDDGDDDSDEPPNPPTPTPVEASTTPSPVEAPRPTASTSSPVAARSDNPTMSQPESTAPPVAGSSTSSPEVVGTPSPVDSPSPSPSPPPSPAPSPPPVDVATPPPVESPPPGSVPPSSDLQPTSSTTPPAVPLSSPPSQSPSASASSASSAVTTAPEEATPDPVAATPEPTIADRPTTAPVSTPATGDEPSPAPAAVAPTPEPEATLSPNADDLCTDTCTNNPSGDDFSSFYYDERCEGKTSADLSGCNLGTEFDKTLENCRRCIFNVAEFETGIGEADWPDCPCCVADLLDMEPQTDECIAEFAGTTPAPSVTEADIDLTTSANDPNLMMVSFNSEDCTMSGIAIISETTVMEVTRYTDGNGNCESSNPAMEIIYGTECEATDYSWGFGENSYFYEYTCTDSTTSGGRRRLAVETSEFDSTTVLCNNGDIFFTLSNLPGEEEGLVYATQDAVNFSAITGDLDAQSGDPYCGEDLTTVATTVLETGVDNVLEEPDETSGDGETIPYEIVIPVLGALVLFMICGCLCCYRHRKGKEGRADQMRRNLGYTPDMEAKGEGNFGPTNKHVAITRGGPQVAPDLNPTQNNYTPQTYPMGHHRAPSEAPSSIIENNIANNYRPKTAAKSWKKRKEHKEHTKPPPQQHVIGAAPTAEELKAENSRTQTGSVTLSEPISQHSLSQLELANQTAAAQPNYGYAFEEADVDDDDDDDDDARSAATGMSGPSKYAPSGYAPSSHHGGVTHDLMSQYEPSVYEADSQYDPSLYGRESEYGDEASAYSYNDGGAGGGGSVRRTGHGGRGRVVSGRASVADTAAMSHLGSVMEMDDSSAYAPSDSYVSSYISSEDDDGRPARSIHPRAGPDQPAGGSSPPEGSGSGGGYSRHNVHRSGREGGGGRSQISASSAGGSSSRHSGARSGFEGMSRDFDDDVDDSADYYSEDQTAASGMDSGRGTPLTNLDETHDGRRW
ncbi:unnamed protein product [Pylaiella littoralis]